MDWCAGDAVSRCSIEMFHTRCKACLSYGVYIWGTCDQKWKGMNVFSPAFVKRTLSWCSAERDSFHFEFKIAPHAELFLKAIYGKQLKQSTLRQKQLFEEWTERHPADFHTSTHLVSRCRKQAETQLRFHRNSWKVHLYQKVCSCTCSSLLTPQSWISV